MFKKRNKKGLCELCGEEDILREYQMSEDDFIYSICLKCITAKKIWNVQLEKQIEEEDLLRKKKWIQERDGLLNQKLEGEEDE